ncbi:MHF histone-fold complex component [Sorochytrium milnesiophthora]
MAQASGAWAGTGEHEQRLRAAIHAAVNDICKAEEPSMDVTTSKLFVAALSDLVYKQAEMLGSDMEKFARHWSRKMVSVDDVKLCARRNETLLAALTQYSLEQSRAKDVKKKGRPVKRKADPDDQP